MCGLFQMRVTRLTCCGLNAFNKDTHFCCGGWPVELPVHSGNCDINWPAYKWMSQACDQGAHVQKPVPDKCAFNDGSEDFPSTGEYNPVYMFIVFHSEFLYLIRCDISATFNCLLPD